MKTVFLRVLEANDKATALLHAVREPGRARGRQRFDVDPTSFANVPRSPFAYWVSEHLGRVFVENDAFSTICPVAVNGTGTLNDFRFVRLWFEGGSDSDARNRPFAKGGTTQSFYADIGTAIRWTDDGAELKAYVIEVYGGGSWSRSIRNTEYYGMPGITWPLRASRFSPAPLPRGCVFSVRSYAAFPGSDWLQVAVALCSSAPFDAFFKTLLGRFHHPEFVCGSLLHVPVPRVSESEREKLAMMFRWAWRLRRSLDSRTETSHTFRLPALLQVCDADIVSRTASWSEHVRAVEIQLAGIQAEIDETCFALYGIDEDDRRAITEGFGRNTGEAKSDGDVADAEEEAGEDSEEDDSADDPASLATEFVSWAVGVAFGRFDVRWAGGARPMPTEPEPFDALPACSPGMLTGDDRLPLSRPPEGYPLAFPESGVLVDDPGHAQDLTTAVRAVFDVVFGAVADSWWNDVAVLLDPKGHDVRAWLASSFFEHHIKRHSKSRRKAPILWQLGTPSGRYSVWLYAHRLTRDTFFQLQNDVVAPKVAHEERQLSDLVQSAGGSPSSAQRKEIATQGAFVEELRALLDEVKRVTPLWSPTLDDGVVLTMAPLWRLVPQHKAWQKELKGRWDELVAAKYDWAQIAMHLWPERVVPKCATDRSLAIAHGLEDVFWTEVDGKWKPRTSPTRPIEGLVRERTSAAVKAALKSLIEAPVPTSSTRGRRNG
jgi:hypothetical protein